MKYYIEGVVTLNDCQIQNPYFEIADNIRCMKGTTAIEVLYYAGKDQVMKTLSRFYEMKYEGMSIPSREECVKHVLGLPIHEGYITVN